MAAGASGRTERESASVDREWLSGQAWEKQASPGLREAAKAGDGSKLVRAWLESLPSLARLKPKQEWRATWSIPALPDAAALTRALQLAQKSSLPVKTSGAASPAIRVRQSEDRATLTVKGAVTRADDLAGGSEEEAPVGVEYRLLAGLEVLRRSSALRPETAWSCWKSVVQKTSILTEAEHAPASPFDENLLLTGELPYTAGLVLAPLAGSTERVRAGRRVVQTALRELTDRDGTPHAELLPRLPLWLASVVRCTLLAREFGDRGWTAADTRRVQLIVEKTIALCGAGGRQALMNGLAAQPLPMLILAARELGLDSAWQKVLAQLSPVPKSTTVVRRKAVPPETPPSTQSDWAHTALLRSNWEAGAPRIAIRHHQPTPEIDAEMLGLPWLKGAWGLSLELGTTPVELAEAWSCVCWTSDEDVDYIELQMEGPGALRIERHIVLARQEQFLLLADSVSGAESGPMTLRSTLPLSPGVVATPADLMREWKLQQRRKTVRLFPLHQEVDRRISTPFSATQTPTGIEWVCTTPAAGLFAPVLLDFHPDRSRSPVLWRHLTVTESGRKVSPGVAAGYRLKLAEWQLLLYRSLKTPELPRAVLGMHTTRELVLARFDVQGDTAPLLLVETE